MSQGCEIEEDNSSEDGLKVVTVQTEAGKLHVYIQVRIHIHMSLMSLNILSLQGSYVVRRSSCVILTIHDLVTNHRSLARFCSLACMRPVAERSLVVHICVPGQETGAEDTDTLPSLQVTTMY